MILLLTFFFFVPPFFRYRGATGKGRADDGMMECVIGDRNAACAQERLLLPTQNIITDAAKVAAANDLDFIIFIAQEGFVYLLNESVSNTIA